jgi:Domain of unknown function (DUF1883)
LEHIRGREHLNSGQSVRVDCDTQCNIMVMDDTNYNRYRSGRDLNYYGCFYEWFPATITPPHAGYWNVVIDLRCDVV